LLALTASVTVFVLALGVRHASSSVTIGQLGTPFQDYTADFDWIQPTVTSGNSYVAPATGTITSWSHNAAPGPNQTLTMKLFRKVADPATYMAVAHDGPRPLTGGGVNTFQVGIAVQAGDVLGLNTISPSSTGAFFLVPGQTFLRRDPGLTDGASGAFTVGGAAYGNLDARINATAVIQPSNAFTFGSVKRNKKKGTASLAVQVPNPGEITGSGKGVEAAIAGALASRPVTAPGRVRLRIAAKGKKRRKLNATGKAKLRPRITYTPTGGDPNTLSRSVTLRKR
jgi:hypothetical protein